MKTKNAVGVHDIGDENTGPYWVALVGRGDIGLPPMPTADRMAAEVWRTHGGDVPVLFFPSRFP